MTSDVSDIVWREIEKSPPVNKAKKNKKSRYAQCFLTSRILVSEIMLFCKFLYDSNLTTILSACRAYSVVNVV